MVLAPEEVKRRQSSANSDASSTKSLLSKSSAFENFIRISYLDRTKIVKRPSSINDCIALVKREFNLAYTKQTIILSVEIFEELVEIGEGGWDAVGAYAAVFASIGKPYKKVIDELTGLAYQDVTSDHPGEETLDHLQDRIVEENGIALAQQQLLVFDGVEYDAHTPLSVHGITDKTKVLVGTKIIKEY